MPTGKPKVLVYTNNHFDPTWRRCWDRPLFFEGKRYASYAELQSFYLRDNLELAQRIPGYKFEAECSLVLRRFLESHPEKAQDFARLAKEGRFAVSGAGENIIDSNMVLGESIVRNYLYGLLWAEKALGAKCALGVRNDAFGNSAQLPQILNGCGLKWTTGFCYSAPKKPFIRGLDGSTVATMELPCAGMAHGASKYPPCESCAGKGCPACYGRGIQTFRTVPPETLNCEGQSEAFCVKLCPEETLPCKEIGAWLERMRERYEISFAIGEDARAFLKDALKLAANPPEDAIDPDVELNPNNTGCYVTRIKLKQECRRLEYDALNTETLLCAAALKGAPYPKAELESAWRSLLFTMFHDAITATHVDAAYDEIMDLNFDVGFELFSMRAKALSALVEPKDGAVSVFNPRGGVFTGSVQAAVPSVHGHSIAIVDEKGKKARIVDEEPLDDGRTLVRFVASDVQPFSAKAYKAVKAPAKKPAKLPAKPVIENSRYKIVADEGGIVSIFDKLLKAEIAKAGEFRPGEPFLESDEGSPWATLKDSLGVNRATTHRLKAVEAGPGWQALIFEVGFGPRSFAGGHPFLADVKVALTEGVDRVDFEVDASRWEAFNARLRFAFPVPVKGDAVYEIPYGSLKRKPYKPSFNWIGANGDWPAVNWAGVQGKELSVALINKGLPSYKIENSGEGKAIFLSVLRSPVIPTYLHEPWEYVMTGFWGMRDAGEHRFEFSLASYAGDFAKSSVVDDAEAYNAGAIAVQGKLSLPEMPSIEPGCARISSVKMAESGDALILRVVEFRGEGGEAFLRLPPQAGAVSKVNLLERDGETLERDMANEVKLKLRPWEIATVRCELR